MLLSHMKENAQVIRRHAMQLEKLSRNPDARWYQFDRLWNEIEPAQEAMDRAIRAAGIDAFLAERCSEQV